MRRGHLGKLLAALSVLLISGTMTACSGNQTSAVGKDGKFNAADYFRNKTIRVVTSSSPGGTTDVKARVLAARLSKFIPGHPRMEVSNEEPHVAGMNFLWNAPNDGTVIGIEASSTLEFELYTGAQWKADEFRYIGGVDSRCGDILFTRGNLPYDSIEDAEGSNSPPLVMLGTAPDPASIEPMDLGMMMIAEDLDLPLQLKPVAEVDTSAIYLGFQREDINTARIGGDWCALPEHHPDWLSDEYIIPVLDMDPEGPEQQEKIATDKLGQAPPHISELLTEQQWEEWKGVVASRRAGGNPIFLPPGTPDEVTEALRQAWAKASSDPKFQDAMEKAFGIPGGLTWRSGEETEELIHKNSESLYEVENKIETLTEDLYEKYAE